MERDGADVTCCGRQFQTRAAATGVRVCVSSNWLLYCLAAGNKQKFAVVSSCTELPDGVPRDAAESRLVPG